MLHECKKESNPLRRRPRRHHYIKGVPTSISAIKMQSLLVPVLVYPSCVPINKQESAKKSIADCFYIAKKFSILYVYGNTVAIRRFIIRRLENNNESRRRIITLDKKKCQKMTFCFMRGRSGRVATQVALFLLGNLVTLIIQKESELVP